MLRKALWRPVRILGHVRHFEHARVSEGAAELLRVLRVIVTREALMLWQSQVATRDEERTDPPLVAALRQATESRASDRDDTHVELSTNRVVKAPEVAVDHRDKRRLLDRAAAIHAKLLKAAAVLHVLVVGVEHVHRDPVV